MEWKDDGNEYNPYQKRSGNIKVTKTDSELEELRYLSTYDTDCCYSVCGFGMTFKASLDSILKHLNELKEKLPGMIEECQKAVDEYKDGE